MQAHIQQRQQAFSAEMSERLQETLSNLKHLQERQIEQLELRLEKQGGLENQRQGKRVGQPLSQLAVAGIFNAGQRIVEGDNPCGVDLMDKLAQRLRFRLRSGFIAREQHHVPLLGGAVPAINRFSGAPVCCREITVQVDSSRIRP